MLARMPSFILLVFVMLVGFADGKGYEFAHGYDPDEKYGDTSVHFDNMAGLRYECVQDVQKQIISVFEEHFNGKEVSSFQVTSFAPTINAFDSVHAADWIRRSRRQSQFR